MDVARDPARNGTDGSARPAAAAGDRRDSRTGRGADRRAQIEARARDLADLLKRHNLTFASGFGGTIMTWGDYIYAEFGDEIHAACRAYLALDA